MQRNRIEQSQTGYSREPTYFGNETQQVVSKISLQWLNKATMKIIWPDQREEAIRLKVSKLFPNLKDACLFEGSPLKENSIIFSAAIIGCKDSEETIVNLGVNNDVLEFTLLKNGTTLQNIWILQPPHSESSCTCSNKTVKSKDGRIFGKCNHKDNNQLSKIQD